MVPTRSSYVDSSSAVSHTKNTVCYSTRSSPFYTAAMAVDTVLKMEREASSGIDVLIAGAGLAGLFAAIELYRQGHTVSIIEGKSAMEGLGDFVGIAPSATRQFKKWPGMAETYRDIIYRPALALYKHDGELIGGPFSIKEGIDHIPTPVSRPKLIGSLYDYVCSLGIPVTFNKPVADYYEDLERKRAGAITDEGERIEADLVIAADGVGSKSWKSVSGEDSRPRSSGFSVYRVAYPTKIAFENPDVARSFDLTDEGDDICRVYLGYNTHGIVLVSREMTTWFLTHKVSDAGRGAVVNPLHSMICQAHNHRTKRAPPRSSGTGVWMLLMFSTP